MRAEQARTWLWSEVQDSLVTNLRQEFGDSHFISELEQAVSEGLMPATTAAQKLIDNYLNGLRNKSVQLAQRRGPVPKLRLVGSSRVEIVIDGKLLFAQKREIMDHAFHSGL